jgi:hypothetical protein
VGNPERQPIDAPPITASGAFGTPGVEADGAPKKQERLPVPKPGTDLLELVPSTSLRVQFSRFLLPSSITRQAFCLRPDDASDVANYASCTDAVFLDPSYDPVRREVVLRQETGKRLKVGTIYKLTLFVPLTEDECTADNPSGCGVRAFDQATLDKVYTFRFVTPETAPAKASDEVAPPVAYCDKTVGVAATLGSSCAYSRCHGTGGVGAAMGLSFSGIQVGDPSDLKNTAINHVAHETQMGGRADVSEETPARFGRAMAIIDAFDPGTAGSPGQSYLMYKLLTGRNIGNLPDDDTRPSAEEVDRLRASVVVGMPMPPPDSATTVLDETQLMNLSNWIARGAPTPSCP